MGKKHCNSILDAGYGLLCMFVYWVGLKHQAEKSWTKGWAALATILLPSCTPAQKVSRHLLQHHPPLKFIQELCLDSERGCKKHPYAARTVLNSTDAGGHFTVSLRGFWGGLLNSLCPAKLPFPSDGFAGASAMSCSCHFCACTVPVCGFVHITWGLFVKKDLMQRIVWVG